MKVCAPIGQIQKWNLIGDFYFIKKGTPISIYVRMDRNKNKIGHWYAQRAVWFKKGYKVPEGIKKYLILQE